jgi:hypothetical protein
MVEPVLECPYCHKEIKLTESLAAPLVEATRQEFESKLAEKDTEVARREAGVRVEEWKLAEAQRNIDKQITEGIRREREAIATEEANNARLLVSDELEGKSRELAELEEVLKTKDNKLAEAQKAQAELIRKQRELDDARRELDLTVETRVQESLGDVRVKAKREDVAGLQGVLHLLPAILRQEVRRQDPADRSAALLRFPPRQEKALPPVPEHSRKLIDIAGNHIGLSVHKRIKRKCEVD